MSESAPAPNPDDPGRGPLIMGLTWSLLVVSISVVGLRVYVRAKARLLGADDWIMMLAVAIQIANESIYTQAHKWGLGKHDRDLEFDPNMINIQKWNYIAVVPNLAASVVARISVAILLIRLFGSKLWFKWYMIVHTTLQTLCVIAYAPVLWTQSKPIEGLWNPMVEAERRPVSASGNFVWFIQALLTFSDLTFVLFPVIIIWSLNMSTRRKVGLGILMSLSLITMTLSILKTIQVTVAVGRAGPNNEDLSYNTSLIQLWSGLEQCMVIILGCIPALSPLLQIDFSKLSSAASSIARIFTRSGSEGGQSMASGSKPNSSGYQDLEMQLRPRHYFPSNEEGKESTEALGAKVLAEKASNDSVALAFSEAGDGNQIRQTRQYIVSHEEVNTASAGRWKQG